MFGTSKLTSWPSVSAPSTTSETVLPELFSNLVKAPGAVTFVMLSPVIVKWIAASSVFGVSRTTASVPGPPLGPPSLLHEPVTATPSAISAAVNIFNAFI